MGRPLLSSCGPYHLLTHVLHFKGLKKIETNKMKTKGSPHGFSYPALYTRKRERKREEDREVGKALSTGLPITLLSPSGLSSTKGLSPSIGWLFFPLSGLTSSRPNLFFYRNQRKKKGICSSQQQRIIDVQC